MYQSEKQEKKSDILIHQSQNLSKKFNNNWKKQQFQILLQNHQLDKNLKKTLNVIFCSQLSFSFSISNDSSEWDQSSEKQQNDSESDNESDDESDVKANNETNAEASDRADSEMNAEILKKVLKQLIKKNTKKMR